MITYALYSTADLLSKICSDAILGFCHIVWHCFRFVELIVESLELLAVFFYSLIQVNNTLVSWVLASSLACYNSVCLFIQGFFYASVNIVTFVPLFILEVVRNTLYGLLCAVYFLVEFPVSLITAVLNFPSFVLFATWELVYDGTMWFHSGLTWTASKAQDTAVSVKVGTSQGLMFIGKTLVNFILSFTQFMGMCLTSLCAKVLSGCVHFALFIVYACQYLANAFAHVVSTISLSVIDTCYLVWKYSQDCYIAMADVSYSAIDFTYTSLRTVIMVPINIIYLIVELAMSCLYWLYHSIYEILGTALSILFIIETQTIVIACSIVVIFLLPIMVLEIDQIEHFTTTVSYILQQIHQKLSRFFTDTFHLQNNRLEEEVDNQQPRTQTANMHNVNSPSSASSEAKSFHHRANTDGLDTSLCVVCQDARKCILLLPCRHICLCTECFDTIKGMPRRYRNCPLCRKKIADSMKVYLLNCLFFV